MVNELESKIRDYINSHPKRSKIMQNQADWNKLCSALDIIGDTELAIKAYPSICSNSNSGVSYILVYGILQALLLQQDATQQIADTLSLKIKRPKELEQIRAIRNSAAGHPTLQKENGLSKSCFISRFSISPISFQLVICYSDSRRLVNTISIPKILNTQRIYVTKLLQQVTEELKTQKIKDLDMYKDDKLQDYFDSALDSYISKIFDAINNKQNFEFGLIHIDIISETLNNFKKALEERSSWDNDSINFLYKYLEYALQQLKQYFLGELTIDHQLAYIVACFLKESLYELRSIAQEIDNEHNSNGFI